MADDEEEPHPLDAFELTDLPIIDEDSPVDEAAEQIKDWFFDNFQDPAESLPYESAEGGYQWIYGGPYDATDIVGSAFADSASEEVIEAAIELIQSGGMYDWTINPSRLRRDRSSRSSSQDWLERVVQRHSDMLAKIQELKGVLATPAPAAGIGHNNPPEPLDQGPLTPKDVESLQNAISVLEKQPPLPEKTEPAASALSVVQKIGEKVGKYADLFLSEFAKTAGAEMGKWSVRWLAIAAAIGAVASSAKSWLEGLSALLF